MRWLVALLAACDDGSDALQVDESSCAVGRFHFVHDLAMGDGAGGGEGDISITGHAFVNKLGSELGYLELGDFGVTGGTHVKLEFDKLLAEGASVDARGSFVVEGIAAGNCETGSFSGRLTDFGGGWKFTLVDLRAAPFCSGATFSGSFAGCTKTNQ